MGQLDLATQLLIGSRVLAESGRRSGRSVWKGSSPEALGSRCERTLPEPYSCLSWRLSQRQVKRQCHTTCAVRLHPHGR